MGEVTKDLLTVGNPLKGVHGVLALAASWLLVIMPAKLKACGYDLEGLGVLIGASFVPTNITAA